jgi:hypothetical protein
MVNTLLAEDIGIETHEGRDSIPDKYVCDTL